MGANVFANGMEISGKASDNKSIAAMPDVCMSPPSPPAGPVPIPYPNTAMASDTADGTKTVTIGGKEAGMKNSSTYSKSNGDEPATQSFGANVGSHKIQGAMKFSAWSSDVKLEGANAIRMGDMTTHNHANPQGVSGMTASVAGVSVGPPMSCEELEKANTAARDKMKEGPTQGVRNVGDGRTTISHASWTPPAGANLNLRACSRSLVETFDGGFVAGKKLGQKGGKTTVCGEPYDHPPAGIPTCAHTEARILDTIMSAPLSNGTPGGTLVIAINWNKKEGVSNKPCPACREMICKASKPQGCLDIKLCSKGEALPPEPPC
jgi:Domain of unknown function (DUF4150)